MQASWGAENGAPTPLRGGQLYGEVGTWKVSMECSVPDVFTYADKEVRGADDPDVKFPKKHYTGPSVVQAQSTKKPAEMDIVASGMNHHIRTFASPDVMTMNDHDHGEVWPPPEGKPQTPFMAMVKDPKPHSSDVSGIMVGYKGHVPRARDKIGGSPYGGIPTGRSGAGFPLPEETLPTHVPGYGTQTSHKGGEHPNYVTTNHAVQISTAQAAAGMHNTSPHKIRAPNTAHGFVPRYSGHRPKAATQGIGGSIYGAK